MGIWKRVNVFRRLRELEDDLLHEEKLRKYSVSELHNRVSALKRGAGERLEDVVALSGKVERLEKKNAELAAALEEMRAKADHQIDKRGPGVLDAAFYFEDELAEAGIGEVSA